ncbi:flagellar assembly protein FliW [Nocardioides nematodiphilus]|uniref:flagellar assembly protein FliW n=1 Tax=Nocardioides nematodiphilus TaxID=2849669 RepID=UPI001CD999CB|nr:flagellar assembly protein FliW [Nocardioides nematodiphilus]MCA1983192.1 flagellar assembly protein FliW [Nocardioides nematodiphilus]
MMLAVATYDETRSVQDLPVIELVESMPGFPDDHRFELAHLDESGVLGTLRSLDHDGLQFLVVPATHFFPDYEPVVSDETVTALGIEAVEDVLLLLVVNAAKTLADTTVNLRAPLLINTTSLKAAQVILDDADLPVAASLIA